MLKDNSTYNKLIPLERWEDIAGFEGLYQVSNCGRVKSFHKGEERILSSIPYDKYGHLKVGLYKDGKRVHKQVHRLVLEAFVGLRPDGMECCHNDSDPTNNHLTNLRWDTRSSNAIDQSFAETHHSQKLNHHQVRLIKRLLAMGELTQAEIGEIFGVACRTISDIKTGRNWGYLKPVTGGFV